MREVTRPLLVWDVSAGSALLLEPGAFYLPAGFAAGFVRTRHSMGRALDRNIGSGEAEADLMEFAAAGKTYRCPLAQFQPRTQALVCLPAVLR